MTVRKVLNVGGNSKAISIPPQYSDFEHLLLDIDPTGKPDIVCDARKLTTLKPNEFDAIYCSHNLEHYYRHEVSEVLSGFMHVLKEGGIAHIKVPDIKSLMKTCIEEDLDIDDILYTSSAGPIMVLDVLYGFNKKIETSGKDYFAHKTGFTEKSLFKALKRTKFSKVYFSKKKLEVSAYAFKGKPDLSLCKLFNIK